MAIIDKHVTPLMSVNDPELMLAKPAGLTAATGMDALTHAIEAYVSTAATPVTDASAVMAIALIAEHLRTAVHQGRISMPVSRWPMPSSWPAWPSTTQAWAMCTPWLTSSAASTTCPRGVQCGAAAPCPGLQRPGVRRSAQGCGPSYGVDVSAMSDEQGAAAAIDAIRQLARDVKIPAGLEQLGVGADDLDVLATNALKDACGLTNPRQATHAEIVAIFRAAM